MKKYILISIIILLTIGGIFLFNSTTGKIVDENLTSIKLSVAIPCQGHAFLIIDELKKAGASKVQFQIPNNFIIKYDSQSTSKEDILNLDIFKQYNAKEVN
jgi:hypothetical protein